MASVGITCTDCHGGMAEVSDPSRIAWVNMPTCTSCHYLTANADALYRNRKAHSGSGIYCAACHGSPHAIYPTFTARDNEQSIRLQVHAGPIVECEVCHIEKPEDAFWNFGGED